MINYAFGSTSLGGKNYYTNLTKKGVTTISVSFSTSTINEKITKKVTTTINASFTDSTPAEQIKKKVTSTINVSFTTSTPNEQVKKKVTEAINTLFSTANVSLLVKKKVTEIITSSFSTPIISLSVRKKVITIVTATIQTNTVTPIVRKRVSTVVTVLFYDSATMTEKPYRLRTLEEIKVELSSRLYGSEYLPQYINRTSDLQKFFDAVAEFIAPYEQMLENFQDIYYDPILLKNYLETKHMYFNGTEDLFTLHVVANNRLKILADRGTQNMEPELQRICNDEGISTETSVELKDFGQCGWVCGKTSPMYRSSSTATNVSYLGIRELVVINLKNQNIFMNENTLQEIIQREFAPSHIEWKINFIN